MEDNRQLDSLEETANKARDEINVLGWVRDKRKAESPNQPGLTELELLKLADMKRILKEAEELATAVMLRAKVQGQDRRNN